MLAPIVRTPLNTSDTEKIFADVMSKNNLLPEEMKDDRMKEDHCEKNMMTRNESSPPTKQVVMMMNLQEVAPSPNRKRKHTEVEDNQQICPPGKS